MKSRRFQFGYRKSASSLHRKVGDCLRSSSVLSGYQIYQEYPVNKINPSFDSGREKFDWVIMDLHIVIECHGEQHYEPVTFGGIGQATAVEKFQAQQARDQAKQEACTAAGWTYIAIPHFHEDKICEEYILDLIERNRNDSELLVPDKPATSVDWEKLYQEKKRKEEVSGRAEARRKQAREHRKQQYQRRKEWLKQHSRKGSDRDGTEISDK